MRFCLLLASLLVTCACSQECGDCDESGSASVVDALCAAQHQLGIKMLTGQGRTNCDVNDDTRVDVVDALLIAQCDVGLLGAPCALGCSGLRIEASLPAAGSGIILVPYRIFDDQSDPVNVTAVFSTNGGLLYEPATMGGGGDPLLNRPSSPGGSQSFFAWDTVADGVGEGCSELALVRLFPVDVSGPGLSGTTLPFPVENLTGLFDPGSVLPGGLPLQEHQQVLLTDGRVLLSGGTRDGVAPERLAYVFDPQSSTFSQVASMAVDRVGHSLVALPGGDAVVLGGFSSFSPTVVEASVEYFVGATDSWTTSPVPVSQAIANAGAVWFVARGEILLTGGLQEDMLGALVITNEAFRYVPDVTTPANSVADLYDAARFARYQHTLTILPGIDGQLETIDDLAVAYGGSGQDPALPPSMPLPGMSQVHSLHCLGNAEIFDPSAGQWHQVVDNDYYNNQVQLDGFSSFLGPRREHAAALLADGTMLFVGGHSEVDADGVSGAPSLSPVDNRLVFAERLMPDYGVLSLSTIDPAGETGFMRVLPTATLLECGDVLLVGGFDYEPVAQPVIQAVERFDPAAAPASAWSFTDPLDEARWQHGATLLQDGRVLITGGEAGDINSPFTLGTTEIYRP